MSCTRGARVLTKYLASSDLGSATAAVMRVPKSGPPTTELNPDLAALLLVTRTPACRQASCRIFWLNASKMKRASCAHRVLEWRSR